MDEFIKSSYEGDMVEDFYHGNGKYTFEDGTIFIGSFSKGHFHGKGKLTYSNGNWIEGEWIEGQMNG